MADKEPEIVHVMPINDFIEHESSLDCPCSPDLNYKDENTGGEVWLHYLTNYTQTHTDTLTQRLL